jgi:hypothetical protein
MSNAVLTAPPQTAPAHGGARPVTIPPIRQPLFPEQELNRLHKDDLGVGKIIVGLMGGIFTIGLVMYTIIAWLAANSGP